MNPLFHTEFSISDSLKNVRKSVLIYETIIDKGYGSKLLSFIKEYSKEIGCSEMFLITDKGNPRACHVYEKLGGKNDYKDEIVYVYDYEKGDK